MADEAKDLDMDDEDGTRGTGARAPRRSCNIARAAWLRAISGGAARNRVV
jgi:hypothetical protein